MCCTCNSSYTCIRRRNKSYVISKTEDSVVENLEITIKIVMNLKFLILKVDFKVEITKEEAPQLESVPVVKDDSYIVVINKDQMGHGSEELGKRLIKAYLYALGEQEVLPKKIIFYNNGGVLVDKLVVM